MVVGQLTMKQMSPFRKPDPPDRSPRFVPPTLAIRYGRRIPRPHGGTCLIEGWIPSKSLIRAVRLARPVEPPTTWAIRSAKSKSISITSKWKIGSRRSPWGGIDSLSNVEESDVIRGHGIS